MSVLRYEFVIYMPRGKYSDVGRRSYTDADVRRVAFIFATNSLLCRSLSWEETRTGGRKEGSKEMWVQLLVLRYCCRCIMNLVARPYKYFIIYGRRKEWQKWNSGAYRRSLKDHFTEIVIDFLKCESYVYWTVHHLYSCVKGKTNLMPLILLFIQYSFITHYSTCFGR